MPAPTRQATPGPSTILQPHTTQSVNSRKRAATEPGAEERDTKKLRADVQTMGNVNGAKDKKKKKRKKKKRTSVVLQDSPVENRRMRSGSRSVAPLSAASTIVTQRATPIAELVASADTRTPNHGILAKEEQEEPVLSSSDKGKGKAKSDSPSPSHPPQPIAAPIAGPSSPIMPDSSAQASEVARLKAQLAEQTTLLKRHQTHLNHHQQSLTCQICLDLMHKPYALAPCGHITCYGCLVRWFTAPQNPQQQQNGNADHPAEPQQDSIEHILNSPAVRNGTFMRRRKSCPICRAVVQERPIEMWGVKSMVAALVRSGLTDLPAPPAEVDPPPVPAAADGAANNGRDNNDPWRNVFRRVGARTNFEAHMYDHFLPIPHPNHYGVPQAAGGAGGEADREQMGWFDMEDGGIYRCIDCYHEIWEGVCTSCNRRYPGHNYLDDDDDMRFDGSDDDDEDDDGYDGHFRGGIGRFMEAIMNDSGLDDDDDDDLELGLLEDQELEEEMEARREVALRQLAEEEHGHWPNYDRDVVAMLNELGEEDDEDEDEDPDYDELWFARPPRRHQQGDARIEEVDDEDEEGEEEDSQYGGSFIDDQAVEEHDHEHAVDDDGGSEDEVEFVNPPRHNNARRPARPLVIVESTDDEDESEAENPRVLARQLGRGTRLGRPPPIVAASSRRARYVEFSDEDDDDGSDIHITDGGEQEAAENDSGLDYISEGSDS